MFQCVQRNVVGRTKITETEANSLCGNEFKALKLASIGGHLRFP